MTDSPPKWASYLLCGFALTWPLHVYKYIPYIDGTLTGVLISLLTTIWILRFRTIPVRIPVEYWWPMLGAFILTLLDGGDKAFIMVAITFIVTAQFTRNARWTEHTMWATMVTISLLSVLNAFAKILGLIPTAYALESGITMAGPYSVSEGIYVLMLGVVWGLYFTFLSGISNAQRSASLFSTFLCIAVLGGKLFLLRGNAYFWSESYFGAASPFAVTAGLLLIWLCMRIVAKLIVTREPNSHLASIFVLTIVGTLLYWTLFPSELRLYHAFLLGLAAGYALPDRLETVEILWPKSIGAAVFALAALNIFVAFPMHEQDSRNIAEAAAADYRNANYGRLHQRMTCLATIYPDQTDQIYLWKARASIRQGNLDKASKEFALAVQFWIAQGRSGESKADVELVLLEMRDAAALLSEEEVSLAVEVAHVALGESDSALSLLRMKLEAGEVMLPTELSADEKAYLFSAILGDLSLYDRLKTWPLLREDHKGPLWHQVIEQTVPESLEPGSLVYYIGRRPDEVRFYGTIGGIFAQASVSIPGTWQKRVASDPAEEAMTITVDDSQEGEELFTVGDISDDDTALVRFMVSGGKIRDITFDESRTEAIPFAPVVYYHPWVRILQILK